MTEPIDRPNPDATWITLLDPDRDPLAHPDGVTVAVKDCIDVAGAPTTAGSPLIAADAPDAAVDAECLAGFRAAGARIVGKANLHELCFGSSGVNPHYGTPVNPLDPRRVPGGSSSGTAVAVATGQATIGIGTDTTGSIRTPSAFCGIVGLKPTFGVVPVGGTRPLAPSLDTIGVMGRTVEDVAIGATLLSERLVDGEVSSSPTVARFRLPDTEPTIDAAIDSALIAAGIVATEVALPGWDVAHEAATTVLFAEALMVNEDLWRYPGSLGADVVERLAYAQTIGPGELGEARARRDRWRLELAEVMGEHGLIVLPSSADYPARIGAQAIAPNRACPAISLAGHPTISVPVPSGGLLPASIQLVGPDHHEPRLLATAARIEAAVRA